MTLDENAGPTPLDFQRERLRALEFVKQINDSDELAARPSEFIRGAAAKFDVGMEGLVTHLAGLLAVTIGTLAEIGGITMDEMFLRLHETTAPDVG